MANLNEIVIKQYVRNRTIPLFGQINDNLAEAVINLLLLFESKNDEKPIRILINSPGGFASAVLAIYDVMQQIKSPIITICMGEALSGATVILCAGDKEKRYALPYSTIMLHQPASAVTGKYADMKVEIDEIEKLYLKLNEIVAKHTGRSPRSVAKDIKRNFYMTPKQARDYGIIDQVLKPCKKPPKKKWFRRREK